MKFRLADGEPIGCAGRTGPKLDKPRGIALADGKLFVADMGFDTICVYDADSLAFLRTIGSSGSDEGELDGPIGVAADAANGHLFVADTGNHRIQVFSFAGELVRSFGTLGGLPYQFYRPRGITLLQRDLILVSETTRVQLLTTQGKAVHTFSGAERSPPTAELYGVTSLGEAVVVADYHAGQLLLLQVEGRGYAVGTGDKTILNAWSETKLKRAEAARALREALLAAEREDELEGEGDAADKHTQKEEASLAAGGQSPRDAYPVAANLPAENPIEIC
jgi:hypothetical protein